MLVEVTRSYIADGILKIDAIDCDELSLIRLERNRIDDGSDREVRFEIDSKTKYGFVAVRKFLKSQKSTTGCKTFGQAAESLVGTLIDIPCKYRVSTIWDY